MKKPKPGKANESQYVPSKPSIGLERVVARSGASPADKQRFAFQHFIGPNPVHKLDNQMYEPESKAGPQPRTIPRSKVVS